MVGLDGLDVKKQVVEVGLDLNGLVVDQLVEKEVVEVGLDLNDLVVDQLVKKQVVAAEVRPSSLSLHLEASAPKDGQPVDRKIKV